MSALLTFRPLTSADLSLLQAWLQGDHIKQWWNDGDDTIEKVRNHYTRDPERTKRFVLLDKDEKTPIGYFQYHLESETVISIDQFLAESEKLNQGLGADAIREFIRMICEHHSPVRIVVDPHPENRRAIRCYEKVGFRHFETRQNSSGTTAYMMELVVTRC